MPALLLTVSYRDRTLRIPVTADWTGTLGLSLHFVNGILARKQSISWTEGRCAECGGSAIFPVAKTIGKACD